MSGRMKINFSSWKTAGDVFTTASSGAPSKLSTVVSETTDPNACGAGTGYATVDGAVAIMLTVFGQIMQDTVVTSLQTGLASEATALEDTGTALQAMEDGNTDTAGDLEGWL